MNRRMVKRVKSVFWYIGAIIISLITVYPFLWMIATSFKPEGEIYSNSLSLVSKQFSIDNYKKVFDTIPFARYFMNSLFLAVAGVVTNIFLGALAGYSYAKLKFKGKNLLFSIVLMQMMLPSQIFIIPQYQMVAKLGFANSVAALVFPGLVSAFGTFFLRQAYLGIPDEVGEAAYLDGCNQWQTFTKIMFPLTRSSVAALTVFTAVFAYSDLMWPLVVNSDLKMMTLSSGLATLRGQFSTNFPVLMAGSLLAMLPMVIIYLIFQRQFIEGIAMTGGK